jgi:hypothetical protein
VDAGDEPDNENRKFADQSSKFINQEKQRLVEPHSNWRLRTMGDQDSDVDKDGSADPVMDYFIEGQSYPSRPSGELTDKLPSLKKIPDYHAHTVMQR